MFERRFGGVVTTGAEADDGDLQQWRSPAGLTFGGQHCQFARQRKAWSLRSSFRWMAPGWRAVAPVWRDLWVLAKKTRWSAKNRGGLTFFQVHFGIRTRDRIAGEGTAIAPALAPKRRLAPRRGKVDAIVRSSAGRLVQDRIFDQFLIPESWPMMPDPWPWRISSWRSLR